MSYLEDISEDTCYEGQNIQYYGPGCDPYEDKIKGNFGVPSGDPVNKPQHYLFGGMELIDIIDALLLDGGFTPFQGFYVATILQYIVRFPKKNGLQDLRKARFYLNRLIGVWEADE